MTLQGKPPYRCLITKGELNSLNFHSESAKLVERLREAVDDGVNLIQVREKNLPARLLSDLVTSALQAVLHSAATIVVNDRVDVALTAGSAGVHLAQHSMPAQIVRSTFGPGLTIGVSTHSLAEAASAYAAGADYIVFGPVFATPGKGPAVGVESLAAVCRAVAPMPVIALGGIDVNNFHLLQAAEIAGVAAIRSLHDRKSRMVICDGIIR